MYMLLERRGKIHRGISILHFAPDQGLGSRLNMLAGKYVKADIYPEQYIKIFPDVVRIDLCEDDLAEYYHSFDLVLHNHVLEHLPCNLSYVLKKLANCLKPDGEMYFTTPIRRAARTTENFDPNLSPSERKKLFGQEDHVRMLGASDVLRIFRDALGDRLSMLDASHYISETEQKLFRLGHLDPLPNGNSVFVVSGAS